MTHRPLMTNSFLFILALVLGALVWLSLDQQSAGTKTPLTNLLPEQVTVIEIKNNSGPAIRIERKDKSWLMTQPSENEANSSKIDSLLKITHAASIRKFKAPEDLEEFGLKPPISILTLNQTRIEMGTTHPMNKHRYIKIGSQIHLIKDRFPHYLMAKPDNFKAPKGQ